MITPIRRLVKRFTSRDEGAIVVEFSIVLPLMLLFLAATSEAARMMWSYQTVIAGVRDAARYLARVTPADICSTGGTVSGLAPTLLDIVSKDIGGNDLFQSNVTVNSVTPTYACVTGTYRVSPAPVGQVSASVTITFPMGSFLSLFGDGLTSVTTTVTDQSRIFGQ